MKKLFYLFLIIPVLAIGITADNGWRQVGNTLNRTVDGFKYSTILGVSPGRAYWYQLYQVDSIITGVNSQIALRLRYTDTAAMLNNKISSKKNSTVYANLTFASTYTVKALNSDASYTSFQGNGIVSSNGGQVIFSGNNVIINGYSTFIQSGGYTYLEAVGGVGLYSPVPFVDTTTIQTRHIMGYGNSPTITAGTAAGTSPTVALVNATDLGGQINLTTGTSTSTGVLILLVFQRNYATVPHIILQALNSATAALNGSTQVSPVKYTNEFTINTGSSALAANTVYSWDYIITQ